MIYRIYPTKDTFVSNYALNSIQRTGSNFGASEILHLYKQAGLSGAVGVTASASIARILTQFDISSFSSMLSSGEMSTSAVYVLKLFDAQHDQTLPSSYTVQVYACATPWDEGRGHDVDNFSDLGFANWVKPKSTTYWTLPGGDVTGSAVEFSFDDGHENLEVDITRIVNDWLSGTFDNNGLIVKLSSSHEEDYSDYFIKMFHGRNTFFKDKRPYIEARWNDFETDDRSNFHYDTTGSLYLRNIVGGQFQNLVTIGTGSIGVKIVDLSGTILTVTGSYAGIPGRYSASFSLPSASYSGSAFSDVWFDLADTSRWFMSGVFYPTPVRGLQTIPVNSYYVTVSNAKNTYEADENVRFNLFARSKDYNPARVLTASLGPQGTILNKAYYRIVNDRTGEIVVPFSTGSDNYTRMSYDGNGNYFTVRMSSFASGNVYRITVLVDENGQKTYLDPGLKFRVM